ncbi:hypothetical protein WJX73_008726 [Symbiochloris irregularis]|uniref:Uncharacterized protein n=1 Tax=Symbiochloris irregularis TaxID=706552 RepID=A0AAW1NTN9_9CHLO
MSSESSASNSASKSSEKHRTGKFARKIASKLSLGKSKDKHGSSSAILETSDAPQHSNLSEASSQPDTPQAAGQVVKSGGLPGSTDSSGTFHSKEHEQQLPTYSPLSGELRHNTSMKAGQGAYASSAEQESHGAGVRPLGPEKAARQLQTDFRTIAGAGHKSSGSGTAGSGERSSAFVPNTSSGLAPSDAVLHQEGTKSPSPTPPTPQNSIDPALAAQRTNTQG